MLFRLGPECLSALGRIDARQPDLVLGLVGVQYDDGVAVG